MAESGARRERRPRARLWLLVPLAGLVLHNVVYFPVTEGNTRGARTAALEPLAQRDVFALALADPASNGSNRFALPAAVALVAPGSEVVMVGASADLEEETRRSLLGLGAAASLRAVDGDAAILAAVGRDGVLVASGPESSKGPAWELRLLDAVGGGTDPRTFVAEVAARGSLGTPLATAPLQFVWAIGDDGVVQVFDARLLPADLALSLEGGAR